MSESHRYIFSHDRTANASFVQWTHCSRCLFLACMLKPSSWRWSLQILFTDNWGLFVWKCQSVLTVSPLRGQPRLGRRLELLRDLNAAYVGRWPCSCWGSVSPPVRVHSLIKLHWLSSAVDRRLWLHVPLLAAVQSGALWASWQIVAYKYVATLLEISD